MPSGNESLNGRNTAGGEASYGSPLVLVVDDEERLVSATRRLLERQGIRTLGCGEGKTALQMIAAYEFETVISDISMPDISGIEMLREVRSRNLNLPVVFLTGSPTAETAIQAVELGAFRYLTKPFEAEELARTTWQAIQKYRLAQAKEKAFEGVGGAREAGANTVELQTTFERALGTLWPAFQPIVHMRNRSVFGYEALLRVEELSIPNPVAMLDAAERLNQLPRVLNAMAGKATQAFQQAHQDWLLFMNLHPADIHDQVLLDPASAVYKMASRVVLEVTEREALDSVRNVREQIAVLRRAGYRIAIDDLGAGYAGLTSFASLEPEFVKLDLSLIRDVHASKIKQNLIGSMVKLCHDMGVLVIAEGVETAEESAAILELGCDLQQGFHHGRPSRSFETPAYCMRE